MGTAPNDEVAGDRAAGIDAAAADGCDRQRRSTIGGVPSHARPRHATRRTVVLVVALLLSAARAHAMVYSWRDAAGVFHFTNQPADVPPGKPDGFRTFEEPEPVSPSPAQGAADAATSGDDQASGAYSQGLDEGRRIGAEEARRAQDAENDVAQPPPPVVYAPVEVAPSPSVSVSIVPRSDQGFGEVGDCGFVGCSSWIGGPVFFAGPGIHRGRFRHRAHFVRGHHSGRGPHVSGQGGGHGAGSFGRR